MAPPVPTTTRPVGAPAPDLVLRPSRVDPAPIAESLGALVSARAAVLGDRIYAEDARSDRAVSFAALEQWRSAFAGGVFSPGTTVAVSVADPLSCAAAVLGAVAAGLWVAPLDPATPEEGPSGLDTVLARTGAQVVLADRAAVSGCPLDWIEFERAGVRPCDPGGGTRRRLGRHRALLVGHDRAAQGGPSRAVEAPAHRPVRGGASRPHGGRPLLQLVAAVPHQRRGGGAAVVSRRRVCVSCSTTASTARDSGSSSRERRVTWINAVPAIISRLADVRRDEQVPAGVRFIRSASAPLPVVAADRFEERTGIPVVETYGMTEAGSQITAHPLSVPRRAGSVGVPVGIELRIVGEESAETAPTEYRSTEVGQVEIRGPSVIDAYVGGTHADRFRPGGWLRTGDLGWRDEDGFVYLVARSDDVINRSGEKVFPREIEEVISADPSVLAVAVAGQSDPELGQVPVAFVVLEGVESAADAQRGRSDHRPHQRRRGPCPGSDPPTRHPPRGVVAAERGDGQGAPTRPL